MALIDTNNLHSLRWVQEKLNIPRSTAYYYAKTGVFDIVKIDGMTLVDCSTLNIDGGGTTE